MGIKGTLLGIDVVQDKTILHRDLNESQLLRYAAKHPIKIIVGVIGGQGFLFGRGNQQITAAVIKRAGKENISVVSSSEKILSLENQRLLVDTGDPKVDAELSGYIKVQVEARKTMIVKVEPA
jgi:predicted polyphosphate/ATP-dependent NAD kinase